MKTAAAEFAVCHEYLQALALALPQLGFRLLHNEKEIFSVSPLPVPDGWARGEQALRLRSAALLGEELSSKLIYIQHQDRHVRVEALISPPGLDKGTAKYIFSFVNNRWVKDKLLRYGILRGYHSHILRGKFPVVLLHVDMEASLVDVNVHPAKTELRFQYGSEVQNSIAMAIRDGLRQGAWASSPAKPSAAASAAYAPPEDAGDSPSTSALPSPFQKNEGRIPDDFDLLLSKDKGEEKSAFAAIAMKEARESAPLKLGAVPSPASSGIRRTTMSFDSPFHGADPASPSPAADQNSTAIFPHFPKPDPSFEKKSDTKYQAPEVGKGWRQPSAAPAGTSPAAGPATSSASVASPVASPSARSGLEDERTAAGMLVAMEVKESRPAPLGTAIPWDELRFVGAFQRCFLFFEHQDQLLVVDQHAFHERILYERLLQNPALLKRTQALLMPEVLEYSYAECVELEEKREELKSLGFEFLVVSSTEIEVRAIPALLVNKDIQGLFSSLLNGPKNHQEILHDVLASVACHAAVRAGEEIPEPELKQLLAEARTVDFFLNCPHGRRVLRWWKASQVAAWFDRLG